MQSLKMPGHLIRRLHQRSLSVFMIRTQLEGFDLTPVQFAAMDAINTHPGSDQATVAQLIAFDRSTIGGVINRLVKKGWVRRDVSPNDRRARELWLSKEGRNTLTDLSPIVDSLQREVLKNLSKSERKILTNLLSKAMD
jgi:DNA-binding MarR family transcriptional regulator